MASARQVAEVQRPQNLQTQACSSLVNRSVTLFAQPRGERTTRAPVLASARPALIFTLMGATGRLAFLPHAPSPDFLRRSLWTIELGATALTALLVLAWSLEAADTETLWLASTVSAAGSVTPLLAGFALSRWSDSIRRVFPLAILVPAGILLALWRSLAYFEETAASLAVILTLLVAYGLSFDLLVRAGVATRRIAARSRSVRWSVPCLLLVPATISLAWWHATVKPPPTRLELVRELRLWLLQEYPHWVSAGITPAELFAKYDQEILKADAACGRPAKPCPPFLYVLRDMLAELRNGHTEVLISGDIGRPAVVVEPVQGRAVVTAVGEGSDAEASGLKPGMSVVEVDGLPVDEALSRVPAWLTAYASAATAQYEAYVFLLCGPADSEVEVTVEREDGATLRARLRREPVNYIRKDDSEEESGLFGYTTPEGFAYIAVDGFSGWTLVNRFDRALDKWMGAPGLILDLRDNGGGRCVLAEAILGRFFAEELPYGKSCDWEGFSGTDPEKVCVLDRIFPREPTYRAPIAVLINEKVFSAGEIAAYILCRSGRARCFGRTTAGETDGAVELSLPGGVARVSVSHFLPALGPPIQGAGLPPDVFVERTLEDLRAGRDPDLQAAVAWLLERTSRQVAAARPHE